MANSALKEAKDLAQYNNKLEQANVKLQYQYNKALADQDRSFQEKMANSAHQREIADLKAAGLNPVLSVTGGNGAATPSGSSASVSKPNVDMSLPKAVMDFAMAQLNSATSLQTTAMNNANAMQVVMQQGLNDLVTKRSFSGDSPLGILYNSGIWGPDGGSNPSGPSGSPDGSSGSSGSSGIKKGGLKKFGNELIKGIQSYTAATNSAKSTKLASDNYYTKERYNSYKDYVTQYNKSGFSKYRSYNQYKKNVKKPISRKEYRDIKKTYKTANNFINYYNKYYK